VTFTAELQDSEVTVLAPSDVTNGSYAYTMLTLLVSESCSAQFILYRYLPPALPAPAAAAAPTAVALSLTYVNATAHCRNVTAAPCFAAGLNGIYDGFGDLALASKSTNASANCSAFIGSATPGAMPGATPNGSTFVFRFDNYAAYTGMLTPSSLVLTPFAVPQCSITFAVAPPTPYIGTLAYQSFAGPSAQCNPANLPYEGPCYTAGGLFLSDAAGHVAVLSAADPVTVAPGSCFGTAGMLPAVGAGGSGTSNMTRFVYGGYSGGYNSRPHDVMAVTPTSMTLSSGPRGSNCSYTFGLGRFLPPPAPLPPPPPSPPPPSTAPPLPPPPVLAPPPPPAATTVTVGLSLSNINPATFDLTAVTAGLAAASGANASDVTVVINDFPVSTSLSLAGITALSTATLAAMRTSVGASLSVNASGVALGTPSAVAGRRRLLDLSVPLTVSGLGANASRASAVSSALTSTTALTAVAAAAGATSAAATTPVVTASLTVTVRAGSTAASSSISSALGNAATLQTALASAGVSATVAVTTPPSARFATSRSNTCGGTRVVDTPAARRSRSKLSSAPFVRSANTSGGCGEPFASGGSCASRSLLLCCEHLALSRKIDACQQPVCCGASGHNNTTWHQSECAHLLGVKAR
jgi:hypothetical protein